MRDKNINRAAWAEANSTEDSAKFCAKANIHVPKERKAKEISKKGRGKSAAAGKKEVGEKKNRTQVKRV